MGKSPHHESRESSHGAGVDDCNVWQFCTYWIADCEDDDEAKLLVADEDSIFESFEVIAVDPVHYFRAFWKSTDIDDQDDEIYEEEFNTLDDIAFWQRYENADGHSPCIRIEEWKNGVLQKIILE